MSMFSGNLAIVLLVLACAVSMCQAADPEVKSPWVSDQGDGTFKNPVLFADYSDPDVIRVGDDFYMTASSFGMVPGLPILHSKDLINWKIIGHAIQKLDERFDTVQLNNGIWAPSIRYHDGWFWIFVGDPDLGILMTKTKDPAGEWSLLHLVKEGKGLIDTCPLWDDDGNAYLVHAWARSRAGINSILTVNKMSPDGTKLLDEGVMVVDGRNNVHPTIEGPKFYKRNGWYYIMAPAGGVKEGWQLAFRSKSPFGPYEVKRVLEKGTTPINGPHQGGWVSLASGEDWFMHFQDRGGYGRIVHLQPVRWVDDWPVMGIDADGNGVGEPVLTAKKPNVGKSYPVEVPQMSDEFDAKKLGLQWQWQANPIPAWSSVEARAGWLRLNAMGAPPRSMLALTNHLAQKFPAPKFTATTKLELNASTPGTSAGLIVSGATYSVLTIRRAAAGLELRRVTFTGNAQTGSETTEASINLPPGPIWLRAEVAVEAVCMLSYSTDGEKFIPLGKEYAVKSAGWTGGKVGLFCVGETGHADFDWFRVEP